RVGLGEVLGSRRQHGGVVGAGDVDGDRGLGVVGRLDGERVGVDHAVLELVVGGIRHIGPVAGAVDRELAVAAGAVGLRLEGLCAVDVADALFPYATLFRSRVGLGEVLGSRRQHGGVVGAGDVD